MGTDYDPTKSLESLKQQLSRFEQEASLSKKQRRTLHDNMSGLEEQAKLDGVKKSRHNKRRKLLRDIYSRCDAKAAILCAFGLSPTTLQSTGSNFVELFGSWWSKTLVPTGFSKLIQQLEKEYEAKIPLLRPSPQSSSGPTAPDNQSPCRNPNEPFGVGTTNQESDTGGGSLSDRRLDDTLTGRYKRSHQEAFEDGQTDDGQTDDGTDTEGDMDSASMLALDVPLGGLVYKLKPMDAVKIIANGGSEIRLTMPNSRAAPFVTFHCSSALARDLVTKRPNIM